MATFPALGAKLETMPGGQVPVSVFDPTTIAAAMDTLGRVEHRHHFQCKAREWAYANAWSVQAPRWVERFAELRARAAA